MSRKKRVEHVAKAGLPPGTAMYVGEPREGGIAVSAFVYDSKGIVEHKHPTPAEVRAMVAPGRVVWLDCDGVHDEALVTEICREFKVHPLAVEDILNTTSRPKLDLYEQQQVLVAADMVFAEGSPCEISTEHVSILVGQGFVLSFQEGRAGDLFDPVRNRIRSGTGRIRTQGADYLLHALMDAVVDGYFVVLDRLEERIDAVEAQAFDERTRGLAPRVYALKTDLSVVRRAVFPLREVVSRLLQGEAPLVGRPLEPYFRDLYDHVMSIVEMSDAGRERLTSVLEVHLAVAAHRMNDVMKVLTIVSTVFIPLSWIAGIYGMNFEEMPELHWRYGYPTVLLTMGLMAATMLGWFRRKGWL